MSELQAFIWCGLLLASGAVGYLLGYFRAKDKLGPKFTSGSGVFTPSVHAKSLSVKIIGGGGGSGGSGGNVPHEIRPDVPHVEVLEIYD